MNNFKSHGFTVNRSQKPTNRWRVQIPRTQHATFKDDQVVIVGPNKPVVSNAGDIISVFTDTKEQAEKVRRVVLGSLEMIKHLGNYGGRPETEIIGMLRYE